MAWSTADRALRRKLKPHGLAFQLCKMHAREDCDCYPLRGAWVQGIPLEEYAIDLGIAESRIKAIEEERSRYYHGDEPPEGCRECGSFLYSDEREYCEDCAEDIHAQQGKV